MIYNTHNSLHNCFTNSTFCNLYYLQKKKNYKKELLFCTFGLHLCFAYCVIGKANNEKSFFISKAEKQICKASKTTKKIFEEARICSMMAPIRTSFFLKSQIRLRSQFVVGSTKQVEFNKKWQRNNKQPFSEVIFKTKPKKFFNQCFDKGRIKNFVLWFLLNYGEYKTVKLVEQLKNIGFEYASKAGISLGIDDLKIPPKKAHLIFEAENLTTNTINQYVRGEITGVERFQRLIDTWHRTSEILKQEVIDYFEKTDVLNPVYMMAFSGARGNISQVRQLVGMRGLMADPQGQIIDFPIRSNFREGLTLTEYIISSYGARKGIVDTALRTANAGYLTRRLVDVAQHVIISNYDCGTTRGIILTNMKEGNKIIHSVSQRIVGRILARDLFITKTNTENQQLKKNPIKIASRNEEVTLDLSFEISKNFDKVFVRSPLTCEKTICQLCYGWSLAQGKLTSIGEAVGVVAAQSIGEPGTQLTMRTFHTGGVFSGDVSDQIKAPFNGFIEYISAIPGTLIRTPEGKIAFLTKSEGSFFVKKKNVPLSDLEENHIKKFTIPHYTLLYIRNGQNVYEKEVIAQISTISQKINATDDAELTIKSEIEGQFYSKILSFREKMIGFSLDKNKKPNKKVIYTDDKLSKYNKFSQFSHFSKQTNHINKKKDYLTDLLFRQIESEKIYEAWTWGYAWILSGKIYNFKNSCSFKTITPSLPILGDFLNTKSHMTQTKWGLNNDFSHHILFSYKKRVPSAQSDTVFSKVQKINSKKTVPIQTTPILFIDLNKIVYKKCGYSLELAKKNQFFSFNLYNKKFVKQQVYIEKQKSKTKDLVFNSVNKTEKILKNIRNKFFFKWQGLAMNGQTLKNKNINKRDFKNDLIFFIKNQKSLNINIRQSNINSNILIKNNKPYLFQNLPYILQWFPNQYKTELGGFIFFENIFSSTNLYFDWLWLTNSNLFFSSKFILPSLLPTSNTNQKILLSSLYDEKYTQKKLADKYNKHKKINASHILFTRKNLLKREKKNIERLFFLNRFLLLKIIDHNQILPKIYYIPSDSFKFSILQNRGLTNNIEKSKSFMSIFLNKKLNIRKSNRQGCLSLSSLTEKDFINHNFSFHLLQRLFPVSKTIKNMFNFSEDLKSKLTLKNNKQQLVEFRNEKSRNLSCLVNLKKSSILLNELQQKSIQENENKQKPLLYTQNQNSKNNKFFSNIFLCLLSPDLNKHKQKPFVFCKSNNNNMTQYLQKHNLRPFSKANTCLLSQSDKSKKSKGFRYPDTAVERQFEVSKIQFFKKITIKNLKTFCFIIFNKNLDLIFKNSYCLPSNSNQSADIAKQTRTEKKQQKRNQTKFNKKLINEANMIRKGVNFINFDYYQNLIYQIKYNLFKNLNFSSYLKQNFLFMPFTFNHIKNKSKSKVSSFSIEKQKKFDLKNERVLIFLNSIYLHIKSFNVSNFLDNFYKKFNLIKNKLQYYSYMSINSSSNLLNLRLCSSFVTKKSINLNSFFIFYPIQHLNKNNSINLFFPPYFLYKLKNHRKNVFKNKKNLFLSFSKVNQSHKETSQKMQLKHKQFNSFNLNFLTPGSINHNDKELKSISYENQYKIQEKLFFLKEFSYSNFLYNKTFDRNIDKYNHIEKVFFHGIIKKGWPFISFISPLNFLNFHKKLILSGQPVLNDIFFNTSIFTESFLVNNIFCIEQISSFSNLQVLDSYNTNSFNSDITFIIGNNIFNEYRITSTNGNGNGNSNTNINTNSNSNSNSVSNTNANANANVNANNKNVLKTKMENNEKYNFYFFNKNNFLNSFVNTNHNIENGVYNKNNNYINNNNNNDNKNHNNNNNNNNNNDNNNNNNQNYNDNGNNNKFNEKKYKDLLKKKSFEKLNDLNLIWIKNKKSRFYIPETKSAYINLIKKEEYKKLKKEKNNLNYSKGDFALPAKQAKVGLLFQLVNEFNQMNLIELKKYTFESTINVYTNSFKHIFKTYNNKTYSFLSKTGTQSSKEKIEAKVKTKKNDNLISGKTKQQDSFEIYGANLTMVSFVNNLNMLLNLIMEKQKINSFHFILKPFIKNSKIQPLPFSFFGSVLTTFTSEKGGQRLTKLNQPDKKLTNETNIAKKINNLNHIYDLKNKKIKIQKILVNQSFDSLLKLQQLKIQNFNSNSNFILKKDSIYSAGIINAKKTTEKENNKDFSSIIKIIIFSFYYTINNCLIKKIDLLNKLLFIEKNKYLKGTIDPVKIEKENYLKYITKLKTKEFKKVQDLNFLSFVSKKLQNKYENILISFIFYYLKITKKLFFVKPALYNSILFGNKVGKDNKQRLALLKGQSLKTNDFYFNQYFTKNFSLLKKKQESFLVKSNSIMLYKIALKKYSNSNVALKNMYEINSQFYKKLLKIKKYFNFFSKNQFNFSTFYILYEKDNYFNKSNRNLFSKQTLLPFVNNQMQENYNFSYTSVSKFDSFLYPLLYDNVSLILNFYLLNLFNKKNKNKNKMNKYKQFLFSKKSNDLYITSIFNSLINNFFENPCFSFNLYQLIDLSFLNKTKTQKTFFLYANFYNQYDQSIIYQQTNFQQINAKTNFYSPFKGEIVYIQKIPPKEKLLINQNLNFNVSNLSNENSILPNTSTILFNSNISNSNDFFSYSCMFLTKNNLSSFYYTKNQKINSINFSFKSYIKQSEITEIEQLKNEPNIAKYKINNTLIKFLNMTSVMSSVFTLQTEAKDRIQQDSLLRQIDLSISTSNLNNQTLIKISNIHAGKPRIMDSPFRSSNKKSFTQNLPLLGDFYTFGDPILPFSQLNNKLDHVYRIQVSGQIIHYNLLKVTIRRGQSVFISPKGILHKFDGDFIDPKAPVITLSYQRLKTGDIIQGIPKVEQFFEARTTKRGRLFRDSLPSLLKALFKRYLSKIAFDVAVRQSFYKIQQIIVDGVQRVYKSQGVTISDKHLEIIVKQMTSKVRILDGAQTGFFTGEVVDLIFIEKINKFLIKKITYEPLVLGITKASLEVDSFLSASSFQQTTRILSQAAIYKKKDFLKGLKENVILGNLIPAGTGFLVFLEDFS